ncbi:MAG: hypothetical protein GX417_09630 [Clostridiales bacterium]|nr:hypothetical protein [Clostridiales bacterium]
MKRHIPTTASAFLRRASALALAFTLLFLFSPTASAEDGAFVLGDCSDDVQRAETRLSDLGYDTGVVNGRWDQADADALAAFCAANGVSPAAANELLFSNDALAASQSTGSVFAVGAQGFLLTYGTLMPWDEVSPLLEPGQSYSLTSCYTGITLHMVCVSLGSHAWMRPELDWDNATLRGFFSTVSSSEKQPVVLTIGGILVAASIQQAAPSMEGEALPEYGVYFSGSLSGIDGIPDAEHEAVVRIAAKQQ